MRRRIIPAAVAVLLLLGACSGNNGNSLSGPPPEDPVVEVEEIEEPPGEVPEDAEPEPAVMTLEEARTLLTADDAGTVPITAAEQLVALSVLVAEGGDEHKSVSYVMQNDISLSGIAFIPIGGGENEAAMPLFEGAFDGGNFILSGLTITPNGANAVGTGLFGAVGPSGSVSNLHVTGGLITGGQSTGGVAGYVAGSLSNCSYRGTVYAAAENVGGLCGLLALQNASVSGCFSNAEVSGNSRSGAFIGSVAPGASVSDCYALGSIRSIAGDGDPVQIGGFIGRQDNGAVERCYAYTEVYTDVPSKVVGAFIGYNAGSPKGCYYNKTATENWEAIDANLDDAPFEITGCTVAELLEQDTYADWDFSAVWNITDDRNRGLPHLRAAWDD